MVTRRPTSWFITDKGRKFSFAVMTGAGIALTTAQFAPHTFFLNKYKDFVHYYSNGKPVDLPSELTQRYQECLDLLKIPEVHRKFIQPFSVFGYDLFHAGLRDGKECLIEDGNNAQQATEAWGEQLPELGSTKSRFGVAVGIPVNFTYKSLEDIEKDDIQVNQQKVDWYSEIGKKLADALILPEKVQQFAICREILMSQNHKVTLESIYPFASIFFVYNLSQYINRRLNLYAAPLALRGVLYSLVGCFGMGSYFLMKDMTEVYYETEVDKKLCEMGLEFIESGVIFYDKILKRNQALRELMGSEGEKKYTMLGNESFGLRQPRLALVHRKMYFESKLKDVTTENNSEEQNV